ncbi:MAG TPA: protein-glutamate O-methyltransferase CheR [Verrucomicrobiae bacterium]|nr:protein-glutamate O-methyltransferase CheR [Verrucomicrobiae bacterium]
MQADAENEFERIRWLVRRRRGQDLAHYRRSYVQRRLLARMRATRASGAAAYARLLSRDPGEADRLVAALSTKVTQFYRNPSFYALLQSRIVPEILAAASPGRTVRIWSAGCATGEEAWSLASIVHLSAAGAPGVPVRVVGTDVDRQAIATAKRGVYPAGALRSVPTEIRARCFNAIDDGRLAAPSPALAAVCTFRVESLFARTAAGAFDLILCRNVLIYFEADRQQQILARLATALRPGGYLALGRVERISGDARALYEVVHVRERVYRRL